MNNLVYLAFGEGPYSDELVYAIISALHRIGPESSDYRIIVYTDNPARLGQLPVHVVPLSPKILADWAGPFNFSLRRKILAIKDALEKFGDRLIYCDSDTIFVNPPENAFRRIRPRHTIMHVAEYHLYDSCAQELAAFLNRQHLQNRAGHRWRVTPETVMFNSGVVGIHQSDISVLDEVLHLADQLIPPDQVTRVEDPRLLAEQFAFSLCFEHDTKLGQSYDIVHHYWPMKVRSLFREQLNRVLHDGRITSREEQLRQLMPHSPWLEVRPFQWGRQSFSQRLKVKVRTALGRASERIRIKKQLKHAPQIILKVTGF